MHKTETSFKARVKQIFVCNTVAAKIILYKQIFALLQYFIPFTVAVFLKNVNFE